MPYLTTLTTGIKEVEVRAVLATIFAMGATVGFFLKLVSADAYLPLATMAVAFYFGKKTGTESKTGY